MANFEDQLRYWEDQLAKAEANWRRRTIPATLCDVHYWQDVVTYKGIVRTVRVKMGIPICWGAVDCMRSPNAKCSAGAHECCDEHISTTCILCKPSSSA